MPGLLTLKTDLKSLKYGHDQPGGGDSGLPYIKTDINTVDTSFNKLRLTKFDDGLIRGGVVGAINSSIVDTLRVGKFFIDLPKGPLFLIKQVGLQLANPKLESKELRTNNPTSGQGLLGNVGNFITNTVNRVTNAVGPTRIYNLGLNTLTQIPVNAFGGHFNRHGILPVQTEDTKYFSVVNSNNAEALNNTNSVKSGYEKVGNRLLRLATKFELDKKITPPETSGGLLGSVASFLGVGNSLKPEALIIDRYIGGSDSVYGIGNTTINRFVITNNVTAINASKIESIALAGRTRGEDGKITVVKLQQAFDYGLSKKTSSSLAKDKFDDLPGKVSSEFGNDVSFLSRLPNQNGVQDKQNPFKLPSTSTLKGNQDFEISNRTSSSLAEKKFEKLPQQYQNPNAPLLDYTSLNNTSASLEKGNQFAGKAINDNGEPVSSQKYIRDNKETILGVSNQYFSKGDRPSNPTTPYETTYPIQERVDLKVSGDVINDNGDIVVTNNPIANLSYEAMKKIIDSKKLQQNIYYVGGTQANAFGIYGNNDPQDQVRIPSFTELPDSSKNPVYSNGKKIVRLAKSWRDVTREVRVGSGRQDSINLTPLFEAPAGQESFAVNIGGTNYTINDLVKFRIQAVNTDSPEGDGIFMVFRSYLTDLTDDVSAEWTDIKYAGRGDKFHIYNGFTRKINIGFKVAALSAQEMQPMYQKLNFLMSNLMPDYGAGIVMRGPLVRMTVGNYIDGQLGILTSANFKISNETPWEIALNEPLNGAKEMVLPHIVDVSLSFTPIGSQTTNETRLAQKTFSTSHIAQNYNGKTGTEPNYINYTTTGYSQKGNPSTVSKPY